jgi:hypothetical protein
MAKTKDVAILVRGANRNTPDENFLVPVQAVVEGRCREVAVSRSKDTVTVLIRGVPEKVPESRFAYLVYHAVKKMARDVTVAQKVKKQGVANAEPVSRRAPERPSR